ncbi:MAG: putative membrane protein YphA (DoxX/SURF4 family)/peroxiredoxin, partial [Gammaproteobacteria bacterium]
MKILISIARFLVGALFIFSGFIKLNDPVGFSYKLQDYFSPEVLNLEFLSPYALLIAIVLVITEVLLGVALLIGYAKKWTLGLLLAMIVFFTFLTFYSAYFNKVTDCGCFGDAIPLVPWESFIKDVILLVLILFLIFGKKYITPLFSRMTRSILVFTSFIACMLFGYHVLMHLPWLDFRAYNEGSNITENMTVPEGAPEAVFEYNWRFEVDGKDKVITTSGGYPQVEGGTFLDYNTEMISEGYEPPVHDFTIERGEQDYTAQFLETENLLVIVAYNLDKTEREGYGNIKRSAEKALKAGYKVIGLTSSSEQVNNAFAKAYKLPFDFYFTDETALKTIIRANPGIVSLEKGTIVQKLHYNDAEDLRLKSLPTANPNLDLELKFTLDSISVLDQKYRKLMQVTGTEERKTLGEKMGLSPEDYTGDLWTRQIAIDTSNLHMIERIFKTKGYPGKTMVGTPTNTTAWYVIQHSNKIGEYLPLIKAAGEADELPFRLVAMMEDRFLMEKGEMQVYGTQGMTYNNTPNMIWPIEDSENVNKRSEEDGFIQI